MPPFGRTPTPLFGRSPSNVLRRVRRLAVSRRQQMRIMLRQGLSTMPLRWHTRRIGQREKDLEAFSLFQLKKGKTPLKPRMCWGLAPERANADKHPMI